MPHPVPADTAATLLGLIRSELPRDVAVHADHTGASLQPPRKRWSWSAPPSCDIVFSEALAGRLQGLAGGQGALGDYQTMTYLEYVAVAVGFAYEDWLRQPGAGALHLDASPAGAVQVTPWADGNRQRA